jgi:hypothetical protein
MQYNPDDFLRLMEAIEAIGGAHCEKPCVGTKYKIQLPNAQNVLKWNDKFTTACNQQTRFLVPYKRPGAPTEKMKEEESDRGLVTVCAVDDSMGRWPRFQKLMQEDSG